MGMCLCYLFILYFCVFFLLVDYVLLDYMLFFFLEGNICDPPVLAPKVPLPAMLGGACCPQKWLKLGVNSRAMYLIPSWKCLGLSLRP